MLRKIKLAIAVAIIAGEAIAQQPAMPTDSLLSLSLDECITIALNESPTIKVADMEITRVDYSKKEVLGQLFPNIAFNGTYQRTLAKQVTYFDMDMSKIMGGGTGEGSEEQPSGGEEPSTEETPKSNDGMKMGRDNLYNLGFSASMPLIAPQLWKTIKLNDAQILQNVEKARASRINLVNQVENAYYTLLLAKDSHRVILENYERAKLNLSIYEGRFKVGTASEYDVLRASVQVKNVEPELLTAEISIRQAKLQLLVLMNVDVRCNIEPTCALADYEKTMYDRTLSIDRNIENNTDLRSLDLQTEYLRRALEVQRMAWVPTLSLSGSYAWMSMSNGSPFKNFRWNPSSSIGLSLSVPLFQGGQRYNKVRQAEVSVAEMSWQRANLEQSIRMQVEIQIDNIQKNVRQIASSAEGVTEAQKAYDIMHRSFDIGAASFLDVRDSEVALMSSKLTYYQSIYNYLIAESNLKLLLGNEDLSKYPTNDNK